MTLFSIMEEVAMYEYSLATCAIENNEFAKTHLRNCRDMGLLDKYYYLKNVFDDLQKHNTKK